MKKWWSEFRLDGVMKTLQVISKKQLALFLNHLSFFKPGSSSAQEAVQKGVTKAVNWRTNGAETVRSVMAVLFIHYASREAATFETASTTTDTEVVERCWLLDADRRCKWTVVLTLKKKLPSCDASWRSDCRGHLLIFENLGIFFTTKLCNCKLHRDKKVHQQKCKKLTFLEENF